MDIRAPRKNIFANEIRKGRPREAHVARLMPTNSRVVRELARVVGVVHIKFMRKFLANILVLFAGLAVMGPIHGASAAKPPIHNTPTQKDKNEPTLHIVEHHAYFAKRGTHNLEVRMIERGNASDATLCIEGKTHLCKKIIEGSKLIFDGDWIENIDLDDQHPTHLQLWSREGSQSPAGGADAGNYSGPATAVILRASNGLIVQVKVRRK